MSKFKLFKAQMADFFDGPPPKFQASVPKKRNHSSPGLTLSEEDKVIKRAKKEYKEKKKEKNEKKKLKTSKKAMPKKEERGSDLLLLCS